MINKIECLVNRVTSQKVEKGERFNTFTHFFGTAIAIPALLYLLIEALLTGEVNKIISVIFFGIGLLAVYISSTVYHAHSGQAKKKFQLYDHIAIYLLIAGTYAPFMMVTLGNSSGYLIFAVLLSLAAIGISLDLKNAKAGKKDKRIIQLIIYLAMGWIIMIPMDEFSKAIASNGLTLLATGGVFYTVGVIFYVLDKRIPHGHGIWHLFIIAGTAFHYLSIAKYVI